MRGFLQDVIILDLGFGFLVGNCVYSRLETSGNPKFGQNTTKFSFFVNLISGLLGYKECWSTAVRKLDRKLPDQTGSNRLQTPLTPPTKNWKCNRPKIQEHVPSRRVTS